MSTRATIYYEDDGVHVYRELLDGLDYLEYCEGGFSVDIPLSPELAAIIRGGVEAASAEREACAKIAEKAAGPFPGVGLLRPCAEIAAAIRARKEEE